MSFPAVSIGMPVYNCQDTINYSIKSLLAQSFSNFELIVSDNCSTDSTGFLCEKLCELDDRIRYVRHELNMGPSLNFKYVLSQARANYFMWAAAGDYWSDDWIEVNYLRLASQGSSVVACTSPNCFDYNCDLTDQWVDFDLGGSLHSRFSKFLTEAWNSHGIYYSLMRTSVIQNCPFLGRQFFAFDWAVDAYLLRHGEILRARSGLFVFATDGYSNSSSTKWKTHDVWERLMPLYRFSWIMIKFSSCLRPREFADIFLSLFRLNASVIYMRFRFRLTGWIRYLNERRIEIN